jgi:hypothetical protein
MCPALCKVGQRGTKENNLVARSMYLEGKQRSLRSNVVMSGFFLAAGEDMVLKAMKRVAIRNLDIPLENKTMLVD